MSKLDVLAFRLRGKLAHFRQPDTTVTQATYPFPPRPTLHGLLGAILGINCETSDWPGFLAGEHYIGLSLLAPVRTVCVQMSLLGKGFLSGQGDAFNRLTVVELVVSPSYRVYYAGESLAALQDRLANRQSVFHTYLGSCFCLTFPEYEGVYQADLLTMRADEEIAVASVIPRELVARVHLENQATYAASRTMPYRHRGDRTFDGTAVVYYEVTGKPLKVTLAAAPRLPHRLARLPGGEVVCLW